MSINQLGETNRLFECRFNGKYFSDVIHDIELDYLNSTKYLVKLMEKIYIRKPNPIKALQLKRSAKSIKEAIAFLKTGLVIDGEPGWEPADQKDYINYVLNSQDPQDPSETATGYVLMVNNKFTVVTFDNYLVLGDNGLFKVWDKDEFEAEYQIG